MCELNEYLFSVSENCILGRMFHKKKQAKSFVIIIFVFRCSPFCERVYRVRRQEHFFRQNMAKASHYGEGFLQSCPKKFFERIFFAFFGIFERLF